MNWNQLNLSWAERARIADDAGEPLVAEAFRNKAVHEDAAEAAKGYAQEAAGCFAAEDCLNDLRAALRVVFSNNRSISKKAQTEIMAALDDSEQALAQQGEYGSEQIANIGKLFQ